jgi:hypothetical protein
VAQGLKIQNAKNTATAENKEERHSILHLLSTVLGHCQHCSHLSSNKSRGKNYVNRNIRNALSSFNGLIHTLLWQGYIHTAREQVLWIPEWFSMSDQNQCCINCRPKQMYTLLLKDRVPPLEIGKSRHYNLETSKVLQQQNKNNNTSWNSSWAWRMETVLRDILNTDASPNLVMLWPYSSKAMCL